MNVVDHLMDHADDTWIEQGFHGLFESHGLYRSHGLRGWNGFFSSTTKYISSLWLSNKSPILGIVEDQMVVSSLLWMDIEEIGCIVQWIVYMDRMDCVWICIFSFSPPTFLSILPHAPKEIKWDQMMALVPPFKWILSRLWLLLTRPGDGTYVPQHFHNPC